MQTISHCITGTTALLIPNPQSGFPAIWYIASLNDPDSRKFAGKDYVSNHHLIADEGIWNAIDVISMYGYEANEIIWVALHERAIFDRLIHYCVN